MFASIPYLFIGGDQLGHPIDAYFEGMSGFTTTGASVVTDYDEISRSLGLWRQFTQWLGGMGIIVLAIAVLPRLRVGGRQLLEHEMPGPEIAQLSERIRRDGAAALGPLRGAHGRCSSSSSPGSAGPAIDDRMNFYEAVAHAFGVMPTGGFSTQPDSAASFAPSSQWVMAFFMLLAGSNYLIMYRALVRRQPGRLVRDEELRLYLVLLLVATVALAASSGATGSPRARRRSGPASSRPSRS